MEKVFDRLSERIEGFAGMYYDDEDQLVIRATTSVDASTATTAVGDVSNGYYLRGPEGETRAVRIESARYTFHELAVWRDQVRGAQLGESVLGLDLDEHTNTVEVWVEQPSDTAGVLDQLVALGLPPDAVRSKVVSPIIPLETLRDNGVEPVRGGLRVVNDIGVGCTLSYTATLHSLDTDGIFTASHCTRVQGGAGEETWFYQAEVYTPYKIAEERQDPVYSTCYFNGQAYDCRESDAAFAELIVDVNYVIGKIARTPTNSIEIDSSDPSHLIIDDAVGTGEAAVGGTILYKVGAKTGTTYGTVGDDVCADIVQTGGYLFWCETRVEAQNYTSGAPLSDEGDSGSPVYEWIHGDPVDEVKLHGILWGGPEDGSSFVYSDIDGIVEEFGSMTVF